MKGFFVRDCMYQYHFTVLVGDREKTSAFLKKKYNADYESKGNASSFSLEGKFEKDFVWIERFTWLIEEQALLAHEILHHTFKVMRRIGIGFSEESDEAFTWYFQHLMQQTWWALKKLRVKWNIKKRT